MRAPSLLVAAAALLGLGLWLLLRAGDDPAAAAGTAVPLAPATATAGPAQGGTKGTEPPGSHREAAVAVAEQPWLDHPYTMQVDLLALDETGLPVAGHRPRLGPVGARLVMAPEGAGADGHTKVVWPSRVPRGTVVVSDRWGILHRLPVVHGQDTLWTLGASAPDGAENVIVRLSGERGTRARTIDVAMDGGPVLLSGMPLHFTGGDGGGSGFAKGLHPHARFPAGLGVRAPATGSANGPTLSISSMAFRETSVSTAAAAEPVLTGAIAGTVFGEDGKPAAKVPLALFAGDEPAPRARAATDDQGQFQFGDLTAGTYRLRAGGLDGGLAQQPFAVTTGTTPATLHLRREVCTRGRATTAAGLPLAGARVLWLAEDRRWRDVATTGDDGRFALPNLPGGPGSLFLWPTDEANRLPVAWQLGALGDSAEVRLVHDAATCAGGLRVEPVLPSELAGQRVAWRVWQADTGFGIDGPPLAKGKSALELGNLPAGFYEVELRTAGADPVFAGRHHVDGKGVCDLGRVAFARPGRARFQIPADGSPSLDEPPPAPGVPAFEVCRLHPDWDLRVPLPDGELPAEGLLLPPGDYVFALRVRGGGTGFVRFTVRSGEETAVAAPR